MKLDARRGKAKGENLNEIMIKHDDNTTGKFNGCPSSEGTTTGFISQKVVK